MSSLPCTLGGGANKYVGILLFNLTYATLVPTTPFLTPVYPEILIVSIGAAQYTIALIKTQHDEAMKTFSEYQLVERATIQQVLHTIDPK